MPDVVYVLEHADHLCDVRFISLDEETVFLDTLRRQSAVWSQRLCVLNSVENSTEECDEDLLIARYCSRHLISMQNERSVMPRHYLAVDYVEDLLKNAQPECSRAPKQPFNKDTVIRFGCGDPELIVRPHDREWGAFGPWHDEAVVNLYIQETSVPPACTLSVADFDLRYADGDWRERLGEVEAEVVMNGVLDVRIDEINRLVQQSSRPMIKLSNCMPPTYIPRQWLEREVAKAKVVH